MDPVLALHAAVTAFLCGLIWTIQLVHYPLFARVGREEFANYEREHQRRISWIVVPSMLLELGLAVWLTARTPSTLPGALAWTGMILVAGIWVSTWFFAVPSHRELSIAFDGSSHRRLVRSNWLRSLAWSARTILAFWMLSI